MGGWYCFELIVRSAENEKLLNKEVYELLLWQQWRFNMAANYHLIAFIAETSSVTPIFFHQMFCHDVNNIWGDFKKILSSQISTMYQNMVSSN